MSPYRLRMKETIIDRSSGLTLTVNWDAKSAESNVENGRSVRLIVYITFWCCPALLKDEEDDVLWLRG